MVNESCGRRTASGVYPTRQKASPIIGDLLRGTIAAVRCREFLGREDIAAAHIEFMLVQQSLEALEGRGFDALDASISRRVELLRAEETRLGRLLVCSLHAP